MTTVEATSSAHEPHANNLGARLNWLRAGVLGANDGIISTAGVVVGVAGASSSVTAILTAGVAAAVAGAFSMAGGEYVSVSTQRDTERAAITTERAELRSDPVGEEAELAQLYQQQGLSEALSREVARELTAHDPLTAHVRMELGFDPDELTNPWSAAFASFISFAVGAVIPMAAILLPIGDWRLLTCVLATIVAMMLTGAVSARIGEAPMRPAVVRNTAIGMLTMAATYGIGLLFGVAVA